MDVQDESLRQDLIVEIDAMEGFFQDLPRELRDACGLDECPVTVRFGPDSDYAFVNQDGANVFRADKAIVTKDIATAIQRELDDQHINVIEDDVDIDANKFVEIRFNPNDAISVCEHHERADAVMEDFAHEMGWSAYSISSHWHMSMVQEKDDLFRSGAIGNYSDLFKNTVAQILTLQERFPAFSIRPFRAEQHRKNDHYMGPTAIAYDAKAANATVRGRNFSNSARTTETRISSDDPYQAAYLSLHAGRLALEQGCENISPAASKVMGLNENLWQNGDWGSSVPYLDRKVRRGAGGYLEMLEETAENLREHSDVFPKHISDGMMRASIAGYERYFEENSKAKPDDIENLDQRLWSLKQQFPEPAEDKADLDLVVT